MTHGRNKKNFEIFSALDYIAAITQHIPEQSFQLVRYYGWYSNRMRGDRKKLEQEVGKGAADGAGGIEIIDIAEFRPTRIPSPTGLCFLSTRVNCFYAKRISSRLIEGY
jgi:hypothetical protein